MIEVQLDWCYRCDWPDGFGARGWKLASAIDDPNIIASTPATGDQIPTAVFIHDILDHALCGLPPSGHRAESIALLQLAARTGSQALQKPKRPIVRGGLSTRAGVPLGWRYNGFLQRPTGRSVRPVGTRPRV
ncbi:hypothetical protein U5801_17165 [Lamprobacter modestohalophilus]|uniref:hypothetical protein n=1 Tax=Lamprobacter modestohalophilus TaxID=1064514 RepID=UPI002ADEE2F3|nr:hypothetical protein [Lamprobacter modestohalophilus]MEA1051523.1 hypothetical protein [Lamprobacter modestohalophilus]